MISFIDWAVIALLLILSLGLGLFFSRQTQGEGALGYFSAGRRLPWWAIGLSNTATYQSGAGGFVMLILTFGLVGNWLWWASWIIWMPLVAIVWAPMWRRMNISTTAELITFRYGGKKAIVARKAYAFVSCFGFAVLLIGYITGFFVKTLAPVIELTEIQVLLVLGGVAVIYTVFGGLAGVVYVDVLQFFFLITGSFLFLYFAMDQAGGMESVVSQVKEIRPDAMKITPPSESFGIPLLLILLLQGFFFAGSPTAGEGSTAQRFMAAKSESEAMKGQLFNTFLALSLRTIPLIGIGIVCMTLFSTRELLSEGIILKEGMTILDDPVHAWGSLINHTRLPDGLRGLLIAVEVAAYLSTMSTLINWGGSFVVNDLLPKSMLGTRRKEITVSRISTLLLFIGAGFVAVLFVENMVSWFVFINSAMVIFLLPLSWFRFFWWRFNAWGELAAIILGLPLSIIVWFVLDYQEKSMWQGLALLFGLSFLVLITITLITKPEDKNLLKSFYERCKPIGWWGPVTGYSKGSHSRRRTDLLINSALGIFSALGLVLFTNALFSGSVILIVSGTLVALSAGYFLIRRLGHNSVNFKSK